MLTFWSFDQLALDGLAFLFPHLYVLLFDKVALRRSFLGAIRVNALDLALSEILVLVNVLVFVEFKRDCPAVYDLLDTISVCWQEIVLCRLSGLLSIVCV